MQPPFLSRLAEARSSSATKGQQVCCMGNFYSVGTRQCGDPMGLASAPVPHLRILQGFKAPAGHCCNLAACTTRVAIRMQLPYGNCHAQCSCCRHIAAMHMTRLHPALQRAGSLCTFVHTHHTRHNDAGLNHTWSSIAGRARRGTFAVGTSLTCQTALVVLFSNPVTLVALSAAACQDNHLQACSLNHVHTLQQRAAL